MLKSFCSDRFFSLKTYRSSHSVSVSDHLCMYHPHSCGRAARSCADGLPGLPMKPRRTRWEAPAAITTSHWASLLLSLCTQSHPTPAGLQRAGQKQSVRNCLSIVFRAISRWKSCLRSAAKASGTSGTLQTGSDERQVCAPGPPCQACEGNLAQA